LSKVNREARTPRTKKAARRRLQGGSMGGYMKQ
jgi:hypothetical protein